MKKHLRGCRFETLQQLGTAISKWRQDTPIAWFASGLEKLPERWKRCLLLRGDFVEVHAEEDD